MAAGLPPGRQRRERGRRRRLGAEEDGYSADGEHCKQIERAEPTVRYEKFEKYEQLEKYEKHEKHEKYGKLEKCEQMKHVKHMKNVKKNEAYGKYENSRKILIYYYVDI